MSTPLPRTGERAEPLQLFATAARGTEDLLATELRQLGAGKIRQDRGGVRFLASLREALWICLWSRVAMRVLQSVGSVEARGAQGLYDAAVSLPWEEMLTAQSTFAVEATLRASEHRHSGFVSLKIKDAIVDRLRDKLGARPNVDTRDPIVRVVAHLAGERLTLSLDLCGAPLFQRGYRTETAPAPMKETLAAAIVGAAHYTGEEVLLDPMCGSGTLLIEAAMIAANRAPGLKRSFAVERWPQLGPQAVTHLAELRERARAAVREPAHPIVGFDKNPAVVKVAQHNAKNAGVGKAITFAARDATGPFEVPAGAPLLVITNPPYGARLGESGQKGMKTFYYNLGERFSQLRGARIVVLTGNPGFESAFHMRPNGRRQLFNGPIPCEAIELRCRAGQAMSMGAEGKTERPIVVFSDGAAKGNPGPGGWGVVIVTPDDRVRELGGGTPHTTNNRMELTGPIEALRHLQATPGPVAVHTDSTYVIKGIREWIWAWRRRGWKTAEGNDVLNRELWEKLSHFVQERGTKGIEWHYVRGHIGIPGNERVDEIANAYALHDDPGLYEGPLLGYPYNVLEIPEDTSVPQRSSSSAKKAPAYSYLSVVDGVPMRHTNWTDCERRVKGRPGARFKKAGSAEEEAVILHGWGVSDAALK